MDSNAFSQSPFRCKFDWGAIGAKRAADRGDIIVLVDVLSFSSAVTHAVGRGVWVFPCAESSNAGAIAERHGAEIAVSRSKVPSEGRFSLSPQTFDVAVAGTKVVLPSLNGGKCAQACATAEIVLAGALVNAAAIGAFLRDRMETSPAAVAVIACGEREKSPHNDLRPAIEDYLGAGAILAQLPFDKSPEAIGSESAFEANKNQIEKILWDSVSGRELREAGFADDVRFASQLNSHDFAPHLIDGSFR